MIDLENLADLDIEEKFNILQELIKLDYAKAEVDPAHYLKAAWPILEPKAEFKPNWHIDCIAEHLQAVYLGQIKRIIFNQPPRYLKSIQITISWPTWVWIKDPSFRFMCVSYSDSLSVKHSVDRRRLIQSPWYQAAWGKRYQLSCDENQKHEFSNNHRGHMIATSMQGTATGKGANCLIIDDPHNPKRAESKRQREADIEAFDLTFTSRLDNKKEDRIVIVMQRLHDRDLTGHVLAKESDYYHLKLPAEAPKRTVIRFPISGKEYVREAGDILHPDREGKAELEARKIDLGGYGYAGQYDQNPQPRKGGILKRDYWRYYDNAPEKFDEIIQSWDMSFKDLESSDFVVGQVWGRIGADKYLLDMIRAQMGLVASCQAVKTLTLRRPLARKKLIENKANGPGVVDVLKREISGLVLKEPRGTKEERAAMIEPQLQAGNVYLPNPEKHPWVKILIDEAAAFPRGAHDDTVDAMTQALIELDQKGFEKFKALTRL
jgi:predicted phage terminase large subunit-like protein